MELFIGGGIVLIYLGIVAACITWGIHWARRKNIGIWGRGLVVVFVLFVAYAIPFGDHTIGLIKFNRICDAEAGLRIYRQPQKEGGIMWRLSLGKQSKPYTTHGYPFLEREGFHAELYRYVRGPDGIIREEQAEHPMARYEIRMDSSTANHKHFRVREYVISDVASSEKLATYTTLHYSGGWLIRDLDGIGLSGPSCPSGRDTFDTVQFAHTVVTPIKPDTSKQ